MFVLGEIYRRRLIHDQFGGSRQSGISPSAKFPYIFIFTGSTGGQFGYKDQWENKNVFSYTGEGQKGDMSFVRGNLALRDHMSKGKRVFLFEYIKSAYVKFVGEVEFFDFDHFKTHDTLGKTRLGIKFFFKRVEASLYDIPNQLRQIAEPQPEYQFKKPNRTEREGLITSRVGQGAYRKSILHRWEYRCAATGFNDIQILIASHIKPWKNATDQERLDVDNGILLSPDYDALFDKHLISFEDSGKIILSNILADGDYKSLGISGREKIPALSAGNHKYLDVHRSHVNQI